MSDLLYLKKAAALAKLRKGFCAPNPSVGACIVSATGEVLAEGMHRYCGAAHAEVDALAQLKGPVPKGATLYVTLEPCCHWGKTPPCTEAIIQSGIRRVVYGYRDPNPKVNGKGSEILQRAGVHCEYIESPELTDFYESYHYWSLHRRPWVSVKLAMSFDGKIAGPKGERIQITGPSIQSFTHQARKKSDAILTTVKTIIADDPALNVRLPGHTFKKPIYVLDSRLDLPSSATLFKTAQSITVFYAAPAGPDQRLRLEALGVRCVLVPTSEGKLSLQTILNEMGKDGAHDVWVEAGGQCFYSFLREQLAHRAYIAIAPKWLGGNAQSAFDRPLTLESLKSQKIIWKQYGGDVLCEIHW